MIDILQFLPPNTRKSPAGWWTMNAPCCIHNGESRDTRKRFGIIVDGSDWSASCFNCGFKTKFVYGKQLTFKTKRLLQWMGVDEETIKKINFDSLKNKSIYDLADSRTVIAPIPIGQFETIELPSEMRTIMPDDTWAVDYLKERGFHYRDYDFRITPLSIGRYRRRIIIPYMYNDAVVGWTSRFLDKLLPKYKNENQQDGYVFGLNMQQDDWEFLIVTEGIFDSISLSGVALMHNQINSKQEALLRRQGKIIVVVGDADKAGVKLMEEALDMRFEISVPDWGDDIKDISEAVSTYGKLGVLAKILSNRTANKIKGKMAINTLKRKLKK